MNNEDKIPQTPGKMDAPPKSCAKNSSKLDSKEEGTVTTADLTELTLESQTSSSSVTNIVSDVLDEGSDDRSYYSQSTNSDQAVASASNLDGFVPCKTRGINSDAISERLLDTPSLENVAVPSRESRRIPEDTPSYDLINLIAEHDRCISAALFVSLFVEKRGNKEKIQRLLVSPYYRIDEPTPSDLQHLLEMALQPGEGWFETQAKIVWKLIGEGIHSNIERAVDIMTEDEDAFKNLVTVASNAVYLLDYIPSK